MLSIRKICLLGCMFRQNIDIQSEAWALLLQKKGKGENGERSQRQNTKISYPCRLQLQRYSVNKGYLRNRSKAEFLASLEAMRSNFTAVLLRSRQPVILQK